MRFLRTLVGACSLLAAAGTIHAVRNARHLAHLSRRPDPVTVERRVSVLVPARDEAATISNLVTDLRNQTGLADMEVIVLDDDSGDDTFQRATRAAAGDPRIRILHSTASPPPGWLGKPYACQRLATAATGDPLVFLDADIRLAPTAIAAAVHHYDLDLDPDLDVALLSAWPQQSAVTPLAELIQPLQQWSWLTTLPLGIARRSRRPSLAAANGQFLVIGAHSYRAIGGHAAVAGEVLEDIALARELRRAGATTDITDASRIARCLMYRTDTELLAGYRKSLWAAFGGPIRSVAATATLAAIALLPPGYALLGRDPATRLMGVAGYAAAVGGRVVAARATGTPPWPSSLAHPLALSALAALTVDSARRHRQGSLRWRGRSVTVT